MRCKIRTSNAALLVCYPRHGQRQRRSGGQANSTLGSSENRLLAELLARTVAPINQWAAEWVARRVIYPLIYSPENADKQRPLLKLLGCALQAQLDAKRVTLSANTVERLRKATGPCSQKPPSEDEHTGDLKL